MGTGKIIDFRSTNESNEIEKRRAKFVNKNIAKITKKCAQKVDRQ